MDNTQDSILQLKEQLSLSQDREKVLYDEILTLYEKYHDLHRIVLDLSPYTKQQDKNNLDEEMDDKMQELEDRMQSSRLFGPLYRQ